MSGARGELAYCVCGYVSKICFGYIANLVKILGGGLEWCCQSWNWFRSWGGGGAIAPLAKSL